MTQPTAGWTARPSAEVAADRIAELLGRELGVPVAGRDVMRMLQTHWTKLSLLAHAVHQGAPPWVDH